MNLNTNLQPLSASLIIILLFIFTNKCWTQCNIPIDAGPDQTLCSSAVSTQLNGSTTALDFSWSPTTGLSDPATLSPQATVTETTTYILSAFKPSGINLITNGDFSQGNNGFTSDYGFDACPSNPWGSLGCEGVYVITTNTGTTHSNFASCTDHTSGTGNMLAVNGASDAINVWCQIISVDPNTNYDFRVWATSLVSDSPAQLQFSINGGTVGNIFNVSSSTCLWQEFSAVWNSGGMTSATICVTNQNNAVGGNDFSLDDISFEEICTVTDEITIEVVTINADVTAPDMLDCNTASQCISLDGSGSVSSIPGMQYQWTASNGGAIQSGENTESPVVCGEGSYTLEVSVTTSDGTVCTDNPHVVIVSSDNASPIPPVIDGPSTSCANTNINYTFFSGSQEYQNANWFVVGDGMLLSNPADQDAIVNWNNGGMGQVCLEVINFCNISSINCNDIVISDSPELPILTGPITICPDGDPVFYSADNLSLNDHIFFWSPPAGATVVQTGTDNVIGLIWDANASGGTLCLDVQNNCGFVPVQCLTVMVNAPEDAIIDTLICSGNAFDYNGTIYGNGNLSGTEIVQGYDGCDSLVVDIMVAELVEQISTTMRPTCNESEDGMVSSQIYQSITGCDSLTVFTTLVYTAPMIIAGTTPTCEEDEAGMITTEKIKNTSNCDSLIIETTLVYTAPMIIAETTPTCEEDESGMITTERIKNISNCDSLIIETTLVYTAPVDEDTTAPTCDQSQTGMISTETITSTAGCDSVFLTTTLVYTATPVDENISVSTCDQSQSGIMITETISGFSGCDSVNLTTTFIYTAPVNESATLPTCDPLQDGMTSTETLANIAGCDSLIITTTLVFSNVPVNESISVPTCDASQGGSMNTEIIFSVSGCDSVIVTTTMVYTAPINESATSPTCDPSQDGMTSTETLVNIAGCDSLIITTTAILVEMTTTNLTETTCDPAETGISSEMLVGYRGCDSLVVTEVMLADINFCSVEATIINTPIDCGNSEGDISITVSVGMEPFMVFWQSNMTGPLGSTEITNRGDTETIAGLEAGVYTITVVAANGLEWITLISLEETENFTVTLIPDEGDNGFSLTCADAEDGNILTEILGTANNPLHYEWSNGQTGETLENAAAGIYTVTVTDSQGCTATGTGEITAPPAIKILLESTDLTCFGDDDGVVVVDTVTGGLTPYEFTMTGQSSGLSMVWLNLSAGDYEVIVTDDNGCSGTATTTVNTPAPVIVDLGPDQEIILGTTIVIDLQSNVAESGLDTILWSGPDIKECENCTEQVVMPFFSEMYTATVVDTSGCTGTDALNIQVIKDRAVYIPNVFSPNGDGNNDRFFISASAEVVEIMELSIYDRWGEIVFSNTNFSANDPGLGWDGTFRQQPLNPGVLVFYTKIRFLDGVEKMYSGDLTILK